MSFLKDQSGQAGLSFLLFLILCSLIAGGIYMLDQMELIDAREMLFSHLERVPVVRDYIAPEAVSELELKQERLRKLEEELAQKETKLEQKSKALQERQEELKTKRTRINRSEEELAEREEALLERKNRFKNEKTRYTYLADLYSGMRPADAADRLAGIDSDQVVIAILREMEQRSASIILSNMNAARVAAITRKMANSPG